MIWLQISAGLGPDECCLVVAKLQLANEGEQAGARKKLQLQHTNLERGNAIKILTAEKFY
jgi:protein subunit release factor B